MQLTRQQLLELSGAFKRLDGERGKTYKFSAKMLMQLAPRIRKLAERKADIEQTHQRLINQYGLTGRTRQVGNRMFSEDDPAKTRAYQLEWNAEVGKSEEVQLGKFLLADLDLQTNNISLPVLAQLLAVISDIPKQPMVARELLLADINAAAKAFPLLETETRELKVPYQVKLNLAEIWRKMATDSDAMEAKRQVMISARKLGCSYRQNADKLWENADDPAVLKAFEAEWAVEAAKPIPVQLPIVHYSQLDLDTNSVPGSVLGALLPVLVEDPEPGEPT